MTTDRQRDANRKNAKRSTGPRSEAGKSASRENARVHGLATSVWSDLGADSEIKHLADAIIAECGRPDLFAAALRIAAAEIDLRRIFLARERWKQFPPVSFQPWKLVASKNSQLFMRELRLDLRRKNSSLDHFAKRLSEAGWDPDAPRLVEHPFRRVTPNDKTPDILDRYERRALSRRKAAIRDFDKARAAPSTNA